MFIVLIQIGEDLNVKHDKCSTKLISVCRVKIKMQRFGIISLLLWIVNYEIRRWWLMTTLSDQKDLYFSSLPLFRVFWDLWSRISKPLFILSHWFRQMTYCNCQSGHFWPNSNGLISDGRNLNSTAFSWNIQKFPQTIAWFKHFSGYIEVSIKNWFHALAETSTP